MKLKKNIIKNTLYLVVILFGFTIPVNAVEKKDCSTIKKLSKAYMFCKSENFKIDVVNTGNKIKYGTIDKTKNFKKTINNPFKKKVKNEY